MIDTEAELAPQARARTRRDGPPTSSSSGGDNIVDLVRELAGQGSHLAEQQLNLVKAEIREATTDIKTAMGAMAGAAIVGLAGLALAYVLYRSGSAKMSATHLAPERTQRTLQRTPDVARGELHRENGR
jgi:hypothetical protein